MSISMRGSSVLAGAALSLALSLVMPTSGALAQTNKDEPDAMDVARTPLEDFNIDSDDIPELLVTAAQNPYDLTGLETCNDLSTRVAELDNLLGPDFDIPQEEGGGISAGRVAQSVVGSFIPFRGIVREVSGANKKRRELQLAVTAGMVRRGYLKGVGQQMACPRPARPREQTGAVDATIERGN